MKAKKLVLCILLSVAMTVTFIPVMSFAQDEGVDEHPTREVIHSEEVVEPADVVDDSEVIHAAEIGDTHAVRFNGVESFEKNEEEEYDEYYAELEHGTLWSDEEYNSSDNCFYEEEGNNFWLWFSNLEDTWAVGNVQYSINGGNTKTNAIDNGYDEWYFSMPENAGDYTVIIYVSFVPLKTISSVNVTFKAPVCGTKVTGYSWSGTNRQTPQPAVTLPSGVNYQLDTDGSYNYGMWYILSGEDEYDLFEGTIDSKGTYYAQVWLYSKRGFAFADNCTANVTGGKLLDTYFDGNTYLGLWIEVKAVHNWKWAQTSAPGLLKNGSKVQKCTCGATGSSAVVPGWAPSYVKGMKVAKGKGKITVKWKKQNKKNLKKFNGYQIRYSTNANMSGAKYASASKKSKSKKIGKLAKKTKYYVQVRTYTKTTAGTFYSGWTTKTVKTK